MCCRQTQAPMRLLASVPISDVRGGKFKQSHWMKEKKLPRYCSTILYHVVDCCSKELNSLWHPFSSPTLIKWPKTHHKASLEIINTLPMLPWAMRESSGDNSRWEHSLIMMRGKRENCGLVDLFWVKQAHLSASLAFGATLKSDLIFPFLPLFP